MVTLNRRNLLRFDAAPTEVQMKLGISQVLSLPFAYNAPVIVLDFEVGNKNIIKGRFKDASRPRVFEFEIGDSVSFKPFTWKRTDSDVDPMAWEDFSKGYTYRYDAVKKVRKEKPKCGNTSYNCGKACIGLNKNCKSDPPDKPSQEKIDKVRAMGGEFKQTKSDPTKAQEDNKLTPKPPEEVIEPYNRNNAPSKSTPDSDIAKRVIADIEKVKSGQVLLNEKERYRLQYDRGMYLLNDPKLSARQGGTSKKLTEKEATDFLSEQYEKRAKRLVKEIAQGKSRNINIDEISSMIDGGKQTKPTPNSTGESGKAITKSESKPTPGKTLDLNDLWQQTADAARSNNQEAASKHLEKWREVVSKLESGEGISKDISLREYQNLMDNLERDLTLGNNKINAEFKKITKPISRILDKANSLNPLTPEDLEKAHPNFRPTMKRMHETLSKYFELGDKKDSAKKELDRLKQERSYNEAVILNNSKQFRETSIDNNYNELKSLARRNPNDLIQVKNPVSNLPERTVSVPKRIDEINKDIRDLADDKKAQKATDRAREAIARLQNSISDAENKVSSIERDQKTLRDSRGETKSTPNSSGESGKAIAVSTPDKTEVPITDLVKQPPVALKVGKKSVNLTDDLDSYRDLKLTADPVLGWQVINKNGDVLREPPNGNMAPSHRFKKREQAEKFANTVMARVEKLQKAQLKKEAVTATQKAKDVKKTTSKTRLVSQPQGDLKPEATQSQKAIKVQEVRSQEQESPLVPKEEIVKDVPKLIGDGTHEGMPKNAQEYYDMVTKSGGKITKEEAEGTIKAIEKWGLDSNYVRDVQKAGKSSQAEQYITDYINNSTPYKGELYRGLSIYTENPLDFIKVGQLLDNEGTHASWTSKPEVAEWFADEPDDYRYSVVIKSINNKTGASIRNITEEWQGGFMGMEEVIVPKNAKHIVRSIKEIKKDVFFVEVEEV